MNQPRAVSVADLDQAPWSAEIGSDFETAEWILGALIASCSMREAAERAREHSDPARLAALAAERADYRSAQRTLSAHDPQRIREVISRYGALARERYRELTDTPYPPKGSGPVDR